MALQSHRICVANSYFSWHLSQIGLSVNLHGNEVPSMQSWPLPRSVNNYQITQCHIKADNNLQSRKLEPQMWFLFGNFLTDIHNRLGKSIAEKKYLPVTSRRSANPVPMKHQKWKVSVRCLVPFSLSPISPWLRWYRRSWRMLYWRRYLSKYKAGGEKLFQE